jgi:hypothetical protein
MNFTDYIKDLLNDDKWIVEYVDGKYVIEKIFDCKNSHTLHSLYFSSDGMMVKQKTEYLETFIPKDLFEIKFRVINIPKREPINIFATGSTYNSIYQTNE